MYWKYFKKVYFFGLEKHKAFPDSETTCVETCSKDAVNLEDYRYLRQSNAGVDRTGRVKGPKCRSLGSRFTQGCSYNKIPSSPQSCSLSALQARLKVAAHQAEEESEETAESFLEGKTEIDDFLTNFMEKRTVY